MAKMERMASAYRGVTRPSGAISPTAMTTAATKLRKKGVPIVGMVESSWS
jgi:hypothetical protein